MAYVKADSTREMWGRLSLSITSVVTDTNTTSTVVWASDSHTVAPHVYASRLRML